MPKDTPPPTRRGPDPIVRGSRTPSDASWRADALGASRHTRWVDELRVPLDDHDPEKAATICAEVTRRALRDLAPAVILLGSEERRRLQALAAYVVFLFDFANQTGLEGERLAQINRVEFDLDRALDGEPPGQPVFISMARAHASSPWPQEALDALLSVARLRVSQPRPATVREAELDARRLGAALSEAWLGSGASDAWVDLAAGLVRVAELVGLRESVRRHRSRLAISELPEDWLATTGRANEIRAAVTAESLRIRKLMRQPAADSASRGTHRAARYARKAGLELLDRVDALGEEILEVPPSLGAISRLRLLASSWF